MLFLLVLITLAAWFQKHLIANSFHNLSESKERGNQLNNTNLNMPGMICLLLYQAGIFSIAVYFCLHSKGDFTLSDYLLTCALFAITTTGQYLIAYLLAFIFFNSHLLNTYLRHRLEINTCLSLLFYPVLLFAFSSSHPNTNIIVIILLLLIVIASGLLIWKLFRLFFRKPLAYFYILLYLCTLEIIPLAGWIFVVNILVNRV